MLHQRLLNAETANINFIVLGLTRSGLDPTIYPTHSKHTNHYIIGVVICLLNEGLSNSYLELAFHVWPSRVIDGDNRSKVITWHQVYLRVIFTNGYSLDVIHISKKCDVGYVRNAFATLYINYIK